MHNRAAGVRHPVAPAAFARRVEAKRGWLVRREHERRGVRRARSILRRRAFGKEREGTRVWRGRCRVYDRLAAFREDHCVEAAQHVGGVAVRVEAVGAGEADDTLAQPRLALLRDRPGPAPFVRLEVAEDTARPRLQRVAILLAEVEYVPALRKPDHDPLRVEEGVEARVAVVAQGEEHLLPVEEAFGHDGERPLVQGEDVNAVRLRLDLEGCEADVALRQLVVPFQRLGGTDRGEGAGGIREFSRHAVDRDRKADGRDWGLGVRGLGVDFHRRGTGRKRRAVRPLVGEAARHGNERLGLGARRLDAIDAGGRRDEGFREGEGGALLKGSALREEGGVGECARRDFAHLRWRGAPRGAKRKGE